MTPFRSAYAEILRHSVMPPQTAASDWRIRAPLASINSLKRQRPASISPVATLILVRRARAACKSIASGEKGSSIQYGL